MHHDYWDRYSRIDSPVHRWPAALKAAFALLLILVIVIPPHPPFFLFAGVAALLLALVAASRIPVLFFLKRLLFFEPFILTVAALALFQPGGSPKFLTLVVKSTLSLVTVILLSNTTPFHELLRVLRRAHAPSVFVTMMALMYRYIFVLADETQRMRRARRSRTFGKRSEGTWVFLSRIIGQLFLRSTERAERIYAAMSARRWK
jgi:cobalt/nickel transport system permease protein